MTPAQVYYVSGAAQRAEQQQHAAPAGHGIPGAEPGTVDDLRALAQLPIGR